MILASGGKKPSSQAEDLLGRDDDEARFVEDTLGGLADGRREKDVSVRRDAS